MKKLNKYNQKIAMICCFGIGLGIGALSLFLLQLL